MAPRHTGIVILILAALGSLPPLAAADAPFRYGRWHSSQAGGGGYIVDLSISPSRPGRIYAALDVSGVARSDDGGSTWRLLLGALEDQEGLIAARGVDVDPRNPDLVLAALGDQWNQRQAGIWRSRDAGASWQRVAAAPLAGNDPGRHHGRILARSPSRPGLVLVATIGEGVMRSEDGGETWTRVGPKGLFATGLSWDPHRPERVWLCADALRWRYDHGGTKTFPEIDFAGGLHRSDDGGLTWSSLTAARPTEIDADPQRHAAFGVQLRQTGPTELVPDPLVVDLLWGLMDHRPVRSRDGGANWEAADSGLPPAGEGNRSLSPNAFQAIAAGPDFIIIGPTRGSTIYRRPAGGSGAWTAIVPTHVTEKPYGQSWYRVPGWDGSSRARLVVDPLAPQRWWSMDWFGLYRSDDAGASWDLRLDGIENTCINGLLQDPSDPGVVHLSMHDNGYLRSLDGGATFPRSNRSGITNNVKTIALSPREPRRLYATATATWHWYASDLFISIDRGESWIRSPHLGLPTMRHRRCNSVTVHPKDPLHLWLTVAGGGTVSPGSGGVYESRDGGRSWTWAGAGLPADGEFFRGDIWGIGSEIACGPDGTLVAISHDKELVYRFDPDAGAWSRSTVAAAPPVDVAADWDQPGRFWLLADGVYRSDDGGRSWQRRLALPPIRLKEGRAGHLALDRAHPGRLAVGTPGGPQLSVDGGETWSAIGEHLPNRLGNVVAFAGDRLVVGSTGNGAFWTSLSVAGERPVAARPIPGPAIVSTAGQARALPVAWTRVWQGSGQVVVEDGALRVAGPGEGSMATPLPQDAWVGQFSGKLSVTGNLRRAVVAIQGFDADGKQAGWSTVLELSQSTRDPVEFRATMPACPSVVRLQIVLLAAGEGTAALLDPRIAEDSPVFPATAR